MNIGVLRKASLAAMTVALIGGCASPPPPKGSGFLPDYSHLTRQDAPGGGSRIVYTNPAFTPGKYTAVILEPMVYYPEPKPTEQVSMKALNDIRAYVDQSLRQKFSQQVTVVDKPGPGVVRIQIAITAVSAETEALAFYQYLPVGLAITAAKAAIQGGRPQDAAIAIESRVTDSETKQVLYESVRGGTGDQIKSAAQAEGGVQVANLKPLIDTWASGAATEAARYIHTK